MKKSLLLILCALISCGLWATSRDAQEAQQLAAVFLQSNVHHLASAAQQAPLTLCHTTAQENGQPAFYVFNRGTDGGFVIVSAESRTHTILGYANSGHFDETTMPSNMRAWLDGYKEAISYASTLPERTNPQRAKRAPKTYTPVAPLCSTQWGQEDPYNKKCPSDNGQLCVTGCVATAAAQIMKFHNYPTKGKGTHSYYWRDTVQLTANFGSTTYNWSQMLNTYSSSATNTQKNAVATLMLHCGIACDMLYGTGTSSAYTPYMISALVNNFRYNAAIKTLCKDYIGESAFLEGVIADLQAGYPCYFNGRTKNNEGHAFICDGLDANGLVHINWGWYGYCDNYFRVSALDPEDQSTGGSASNAAFTEQVVAYTNIRPTEGGLFEPLVTVENMYTNGTRFGRYDDIQFITENFMNQGLDYWEGQPAVQVYKNGSLYKTCSINWTAQLNASYYYYSVYFPTDFSTLPAGNYEIVPVVKSTISTFSSTPSPILVRNIGEYRCQLKVTNDSIIITPPEVETPEEPEVPTVEYLSSRYDTKNNVVLCMTFDDAPCGDVYFVGTPTNWKANFNNCPKFEALPDYEGWYAVAVPYSAGIQGKPIQAELDGSFSWDNQCGAPSAWINLGGTGSKTADISSGYGDEANIAYPSAGCYIYELAYWKKHQNNPCANNPTYQYTIVIFAPDACSEMKPAIIGTFNNWTEGVPMTADTYNGNTYYYAVIQDKEGGLFKFREASDTDWSNELQYFDESTNTWYNFPNLVLPKGSAVGDTMLVYDYSDNDLYRYTQCNKVYYDIYVGFVFPDHTPSAVDLIGTFDNWTGTPMTYHAAEDFWYTYIRATEDDYFAIVEHNNLDNHIEMYVSGEDKWYTANVLVSQSMREDEEGKYIWYDLSNSSYYRWSVIPETTGIETIQKDDSSVQKILRNGVLYIRREGKTYTIDGLKVTH